MQSLTVKILSFSAAAAEIVSVRRDVFQVEQGVDAAVDFDGLDETATHIIGYVEDIAVGTARIRYLKLDVTDQALLLHSRFCLGDGYPNRQFTQQLAKIERVAVLSSYRGQGIGRSMMQLAIGLLDQQAVPVGKVHAQSHTAQFYQKLGFEPQGEIFYEANIPHLAMKRYHPLLKAA